MKSGVNISYRLKNKDRYTYPNTNDKHILLTTVGCRREKCFSTTLSDAHPVQASQTVTKGPLHVTKLTHLGL